MNVTVQNEWNLMNNVRVELIVGWETFIAYTDAQGFISLDVTPECTGTLVVEIVAMKEGFDYGRATFTLTINEPIPAFNSLLLLLTPFGLISCMQKKKR